MLAFVAAVVVAPICEELLFRLCCKAGSRNGKTRELGWRTPPAADRVAERGMTEAIATVTQADVSSTIAPVMSRAVPADPPPNRPRRPAVRLAADRRQLAAVRARPRRLRPGPVPLFLLALILGYVYQRTHRIVPSIVTHALFNGMSLFVLWRRDVGQRRM